MLRILPKYIIREHIGPFIFALSVINSIFILNLLFRDLGKFLSKGIAINIILEFLFLNLAWMIALSVPMAVLSATIMAFGRLSAENEITAIKASGISLYRILLVMLVVSALLACSLIWFNNNVLPDFNHRARLLALDIARKKPMIDLEPGVLYSEIPKYTILVERVEEKGGITYVDNVHIWDQTEPNIRKTINADRGELDFIKETGLLQFTLYDGEAQEVDFQNTDTFERLSFKKHIIKIEMSDMLLQRSAEGYRGDREKSAEQLLQTVRENEKKLDEKRQKLKEKLEQQLAAFLEPDAAKKYSLQSAVSRLKQFKRQIQSDASMIKSYLKSNNIYLVEVHKKYSIPAACMVFVLVGAPLGMLTRRKGWAVAAGLSICFFLTYWAFLIGGEILADRQIITPFLAMWSPNIVVGGLGLILVFRAVGEIRIRRWRYR
jgi:lipopolysaccharide export system permease protein